MRRSIITRNAMINRHMPIFLRIIVFIFLAIVHIPLFAADGDVFTAKTIEGVDMTFKVISETDKTCQVGEVVQTGGEVINKPAIDKLTIGAITIPNNVNGYSVTRIAYYAFYRCKDLTSIVIPNSVITINPFAFVYCSSLTSITIPNSVTSIYAGAFMYCSSLESVTIGSGVNFIGSSAFYNCTSLTSVTIYSSALSTGGNFDVFKGCDNLKSVMVVVTDYSAFCNNSVVGVLFTYTSKRIKLIDDEGNEILEYIVPNDVTSIGNNAFQGLGLKSVSIGNKVTSIGEKAFYNCNGLSSISIPNNVSTIGSYAFYACHGLTSVTIGNGVTNIGNNAFASCNSLTSVKIPNSITSLEQCTFEGCSSLTSVTIPNSVLSIEERAFASCKGLTSITIPNSVKSIRNYAFSGCSGLTSIHINDLAAWCKISFEKSDANPLAYAHHLFINDIEVTDLTIPESVTFISGYAFSGCSGLTSVIIGNNVTGIGTDAFNNCQDLSSILYTGIIPPNNWIATTSTYVPSKSSYTNPIYINGASESCIKEMVSFDKEFIYTGQVPSPQWTNHMIGYNVEVSFPTLKANAGFYKNSVSATFTKGDVSFTAIILYEYTIKQASLSIKANNSSREYGEDNPDFSCSYSGFVNGENENVIKIKPTMSTTANKLSDVGNYPINVNGGEAANYSFIYLPGVLTVTKAPLTVRVNDASRQYGANDPQFTAAYKDLKNGEIVPKWTSDLKFETTATKSSDIGEYEINATGVPTNYELSSVVPGKLTITQAPLTIKANDASRKYFEQDSNFEYSCFGFLNNDDKQVLTKKPTIQVEATQTSSVGKYKITPSGAEAKNYTMSYEQGELTITKRTLTATSHCSRLYGEDNPILPIEYSGFVNDETEEVIATKPIATTTAEKTSTVGNYPITISGGEATNYDFVYEQGELTITKRTLTATSHCSRFYGEENPSLPIEYSGFVNNETEGVIATPPIATTTAEKTSTVGNYPITISGGEATNYDFVYEQGVLTVTKAPLSAKVNDATRQYGIDNPTFTIGYTGLKNDETAPVWTTAPTFQTEATKASGVGEYAIKAVNGIPVNYELEIADGTLSITPAPLTIKANDVTRRYFEEDPSFSFSCSGFLNDDNIEVLTKMPLFTTDATQTSDVGKYTITLSDAEAKNYEITYVNGTLTITQAQQEIIWDIPTDECIVGSEIELIASATSRLPVSFTTNNSDIASLSERNGHIFVTLKKEGTAEITASQEGNNNYEAAESIVWNINIMADGINVVSVEDLNNLPTYNLMGQRVQRLKAGHIYVVNGKKVLIRNKQMY